jgi:predicted RNA-binding protein YlxR (DUF448 family)
VVAPQRMCAGCRTRREQAALVRFVAHEGKLRLATAGAQGRGVYVCPQEACYEQAIKRRAFSHVLRRNVQIDGLSSESFARVCAERKAVR